MENLTVKELQSICRAFDLEYRGLLKQDLIDLVSIQMSCIHNSNVPNTDTGETSGTMSTPTTTEETPSFWSRQHFSKIKNRIFRPLHRVCAVVTVPMPNQNTRILPRVPNIMIEIGALFGFIAGIGMIYQAAMLYFSEIENVEVPIRRFRW